jgi:hypothetical protein
VECNTQQESCVLDTIGVLTVDAGRSAGLSRLSLLSLWGLRDGQA